MLWPKGSVTVRILSVFREIGEEIQNGRKVTSKQQTLFFKRASATPRIAYKQLTFVH